MEYGITKPLFDSILSKPNNYKIEAHNNNTWNKKTKILTMNCQCLKPESLEF